MRFVDYLGTPANIIGAGAAIVLGGGAALLGLPAIAVIGATVTAYAGGALAFAPTKREIRVTLGDDNRGEVEDALGALRRQLAATSPSALPDSIRTRVAHLLDSIAELLPKWDALSGLDEGRTVIHNILTDYLPTTLNAYLALPKTYLTRTKANAEREVIGQIDTLQQAVDGIADTVYAGVERTIAEQSQFLNDKFHRGGSLQL